jgi:hypothetical protein
MSLDFTVPLDVIDTERTERGAGQWLLPSHSTRWLYDGVHVMLFKRKANDTYWITSRWTDDERRFSDRGPYTRTEVITLLRLQGNKV